MRHDSPWINFAAGAAIGTLLGLITGLSASAVVSTILGVLAAGLLALLGLNQNSQATTDQTSVPHSVLRVFGFGTFCSVFLVTGILLRTHDVLAPSLTDQAHKLNKGNVLTGAEVHQVLLLKAFGLTAKPEKAGSALEPASNKTVAAATAGYLFASQSEICEVLRRDQYKDAKAYLEGLRAHGEEYASLANALARTSPTDQDELSAALSKLVCK